MEKYEGKINLITFILLILLILVCYSNTFNVSFHLDDFQNITQRSQLHIKNLYPGTIYNTAFKQSDKKRNLYRPIACLTLALNWYFGKEKVTGYHVVNISVHILTVFFLYLTFLSLFNTPNLKGKYDGNEHFIAVLAAVLWAVNPIQTQAVTYIVQRMASMAAMFYVFGLYFYIKARTCFGFKFRFMFYSGVFFAFLLAVGSKENAILFPVSIFLLELIFFKDMSDRTTRIRFIGLGCILVAAMFVLGVFLFMNGDFITRIQEGYANRTFTLSQRLMTEPRIVVFYLSQIFYPIADRLSISHDIVVSTSLLHPWSTLPAILFIIVLVGLAFLKIDKNPLFSFAVFFFFLNHVIESSIIPLELVFEHRNYLPSFFLFFPVAAGLNRAINYYKKKNKAMSVIMICFVTILTIVLGRGTYIRNMAWADEKTLWQDAMAKAPGRARPYHNLAAGYYTRTKNYNKVFELCEKAMELDDNTLHKAKVISLMNIANVYVKQKKDYDKVIQIYNKILNIDPDRLKARYHLVLALVKTDQLETALKNCNHLLSKKSESVKYLRTKAFVLLKKREPEKALPCLKKAIKKAPADEHLIISMGLAKSMLGKNDSAKHYLNLIPRKSPLKLMSMFILIENSIRSGDLHYAKKYAENVVLKFNSGIIQRKLRSVNEPNLLWPVSTDLIAPVISGKMKEHSEKILKFEKLENEG